MMTWTSAMKPPPPTPWSVRAAMSMPTLPDSPATADPTT